MAKAESLDVAALVPLTTQDPVLCDVDLPLRGVFHPRGFTAEVSTNSPEVLEAVQESWGRFHKVFSEPPLQLRIGVMGRGSGICAPSPIYRSWRNVMITVADADNFSVTDLSRGSTFAWFTESTVEDRAYLRYRFLDACVLSMLQHLYLAPVHAGCVRFGDRGVLLCGDSGAGKSSLAYACARRGWTFVSDDASALIRSRGDLTIVGTPHQIHFREAAVDLFPELGEQVLRQRARGELAIELVTATAPNIITSLTSPVDYIVFLNRRDPEPPRLVPISKDAALTWFEQVVTHGEEESRAAQKATLRRLLEKPIMELHYQDLDWAVDRLEAMVRDGE